MQIVNEKSCYSLPMINTAYLERDRLQRGVTQREFASMLDMSISGYARLLRTRSAHANTINRIATRLKLNRDKLVPNSAAVEA